MTYDEAGNLTLGVTNTIISSAGVDLGRVGGTSTATLVLLANNQIGESVERASRHLPLCRSAISPSR